MTVGISAPAARAPRRGGPATAWSRFELDDEVVETELLVRVDRPGELVDRAAEPLAQVLPRVRGVGIPDLHADRPSQRGRVPALSRKGRVEVGESAVEQ